jgi:hypothetical protein
MLTHLRAPLLLVVVLAAACSESAAAPSTSSHHAEPVAPVAAPLPAAPAPAVVPAPPRQAGELVRVSAPLENALVASPLTVSGQARGSWFFEATFPVVLLDADGKELAKHYAVADGEWMTEEFVSFTAKLEFAKPAARAGTLVLERANASGLPEHDAEHRVPVRFAD